MGPPAFVAAVMIPSGALLLSQFDAAWQLYLIYGLMIGFLGTGALAAPAMANITRWYIRRRGMAVGMVAGGPGARRHHVAADLRADNGGVWLAHDGARLRRGGDRFPAAARLRAAAAPAEPATGAGSARKGRPANRCPARLPNVGGRPAGGAVLRDRRMLRRDGAAARPPRLLCHRPPAIRRAARRGCCR